MLPCRRNTTLFVEIGRSGRALLNNGNPVRRLTFPKSLKQPSLFSEQKEIPGKTSTRIAGTIGAQLLSSGEEC